MKLFCPMILALACALLLGCQNVTSGSPASNNNLEFCISGYLRPSQFPIPTSSAINVPGTSSNSYFCYFSVYNDTNGVVGTQASNAIVTVNGQQLTFNSSANNYQGTLPGPFTTGSTFQISVACSGMDAITQTMMVPASSVPSTYRITPTIGSGGSVAPPYEIVPLSPWQLSGSLIALLYDSAPSYQAFSWFTNQTATNSCLFSIENLEYGSSNTLAAKERFVAWATDQVDFAGYGRNGSSPSRTRVFATDGFVVGGNF